MMQRTISNFGASQASHLAHARAAMVKANKFQLAQSLGHSWPLAQQLICPMKEIPPSHKETRSTAGNNDGGVEEGGSTH